MARRKRLLIASLLAIAGGVAGCSNVASLGVGITADPLGIQFTLKTTADVPSYTITQGAPPPATGPASRRAGGLPIVVVPAGEGAASFAVTPPG